MKRVRTLVVSALLTVLGAGVLTACGESELPGTKTTTPTAGSLLIAVSPDTATITAVANTSKQTYTLKSNTELSLPAETYLVTLSETGYVTQTASLTVVEGKTTTAAYTLTPSAATPAQ